MCESGTSVQGEVSIRQNRVCIRRKTCLEKCKANAEEKGIEKFRKFSKELKNDDVEFINGDDLDTLGRSLKSEISNETSKNHELEINALEETETDQADEKHEMEDRNENHSNTKWTSKWTNLLMKQKRLKKKQLRYLNQKLFTQKLTRNEKFIDDGKRETKESLLEQPALQNGRLSLLENDRDDKNKTSEIFLETNSNEEVSNRKNKVQSKPSIASVNKPDQSTLMRKYLDQLKTILTTNNNLAKPVPDIMCREISRDIGFDLKENYVENIANSNGNDTNTIVSIDESEKIADRLQVLEELFKDYLSVANYNKNRPHNSESCNGQSLTQSPLDKQLTQQNAALHQNVIVNVSLSDKSVLNKWSKPVQPNQDDNCSRTSPTNLCNDLSKRCADGNGVLPNSNDLKKNKRRRYNLKKRLRRRLMNQLSQVIPTSDGMQPIKCEQGNFHPIKCERLNLPQPMKCENELSSCQHCSRMRQLAPNCDKIRPMCLTGATRLDLVTGHTCRLETFPSLPIDDVATCEACHPLRRMCLTDGLVRKCQPLKSRPGSNAG